MPKLTFLWTDAFLLCLAVAMAFYLIRVRRSPNLRYAWSSVARTPSAMAAAVILAFFLLLGFLDSLHYRPLMPALPGQEIAAKQYAPVVRSVLDDMLDAAGISAQEKTYSAPFSRYQFSKESILREGVAVRDYPRLKAAGQGIESVEQQRQQLWRLGGQAALYSLLWCFTLAIALTFLGRRKRPAEPWSAACSYWWQGQGLIAWRAVWISASGLGVVLIFLLVYSGHYHVLGTDRTGNNMVWQAAKSVRTALVIGTLTTFAMLPPALVFGVAAGYFRGWVDDVIQYLYTTLTSIPGVLLIAACVLMMQVYIDTHPEKFTTLAARADLRLFLLCLILGLTGWAGLCRLLRAEVMKLRELDYVQAARAFGVGPVRIMIRHLLPNVMHIVLITLVLEFSGLVLYEAVLSYLGIGVDPSMPSFGRLIDAARTELSRDPMIWWGLTAAFMTMLALVLSANIFADAVQTAFDPRTRKLTVFRLSGRSKP